MLTADLRSLLSCCCAALAVGIACGEFAFAADDAPQTAVFVMQADGQNVKKLAQAPGRRTHGAPSWSKDSKFIAFHALTNDPQKPDGHVFVAREDGTDVKDLGIGAFPTWSPDGKQILFSVPMGAPEATQPGVWIMNADGKGRQWMFVGAAPSFSPDGGKILYTSNHEGQPGVYAYDILESKSQKLIQQPLQSPLAVARWSPDAKKVLCIDLKGGRHELLLGDAANAQMPPKVRTTGDLGFVASWQPADRIVISMKHGDAGQRLFLLNPDNEMTPALIPGQEQGKIWRDPTWSPDGQRLIFISDQN
jgi:TolB protein